MTIKWFNSGKSVSEIYQQVNLQFAFLTSSKEGDKQCHDFIKCRDFLHDAVKAQLNKNKWQIYGFVYEYGKNPPVCTEAMNMLVRMPLGSLTGTAKATKVKEFRELMEHSSKLLHHYEKMMKIPKSVVTDDEDKWGNPVAVFRGHPIWVSSPFLVSAYTYLIRMGDKKLKFKNNDELVKAYKDEIDKRQKAGSGMDNDMIYLKDIWNKLDIVLKNAGKIFALDKNDLDPIYFDKNVPTGTWHNCCGIQSLCRFISPNKVVKDLVQKELKKLKRST
jgi:hypothetical protein